MRLRKSTAAFVCLLIPMVVAAACGGGTDTPTAPTLPGAPYSQTDVRAGSGAEAVAGRTLVVNYTLWLYDPAQAEGKGRQIESGQIPNLVLGQNRVIAGWERGIPGMRVGGLRRLVIPPELAYGAAGNGPIPPNATLVFDVELVNVQ
jgi:FKBP-type peptidyl-prolyl cis-trans isomerase FkpA